MSLIWILTLSSAFGALKGYELKTSFEYANGARTVKSETTIVIDDKNMTWMTLSPPKNGLALIGRVVGHHAKRIDIEYVVVDTENPTSAVIVSPTIKAIIGEKANLVINEPKGE